jgi:threonine dehydrogenase-like Zn-dependent dehydrogenase
MTLIWLKQEGAGHVTVSDYAPSRRALAGQLGADLVVDPATTNVQAAHEGAVGSRPTVVFECVGVQGTLEQAMEMAERQGTVVVVGVCMLEDTIRPMVGINKQLTLKFVLGYTGPEYAEALAALTSGAVDTRPLITRIVGLDELPEAFAALADPAECKVVLKP